MTQHGRNPDDRGTGGQKPTAHGPRSQIQARTEQPNKAGGADESTWCRLCMLSSDVLSLSQSSSYQPVRQRAPLRPVVRCSPGRQISKIRSNLGTTSERGRHWVLSSVHRAAVGESALSATVECLGTSTGGPKSRRLDRITIRPTLRWTDWRSSPLAHPPSPVKPSLLDNLSVNHPRLSVPRRS